MHNGYLLLAALTYIEENLTEPLDLSKIAGACYCSTSGLQKIFGAALRYSVKDYVTKRRLSRAARELVQSKVSVTEIALKYQYSSPEAFTRAFTRIFNETPSQYRRSYSFHNLFPRLTVEFEPEGRVIMKKVDISELYDLLKALQGTYMLCIDLIHFERVNINYGIAVGDALLAEAAKRIERCLGAEMTVFRVGGDEFLTLTGLSDRSAAEQLAAQIAEQNAQHAIVQGTEYLLELRVAVAPLPESSSLFQDLLQRFHEAVDSQREKERA